MFSLILSKKLIPRAVLSLVLMGSSTLVLALSLKPDLSSQDANAGLKAALEKGRRRRLLSWVLKMDS